MKINRVFTNFGYKLRLSRQSTRLSFIILLLVAGLASCSGSIGLGVPIPAGGTNPETGNNATEVNVPSDNTGESTPTASLPLPSLKTNSFLAFSPDSENNVPVIGSVDLDTLPSGGQIVVSSKKLDSVKVATTSLEIPFVRTAYAMSVELPIDKSNIVETNPSICADDTAVCCDIDSDGTFECYLPLKDHSVSEVYVGIVDAGQNVLVSTLEVIQANLKWLAKEPSSLAVAGNEVFTVVDGVAVQLQNNVDEALTVQGSHLDTLGAYRKFDAVGKFLTYDSANSYFGFLDNDTGVSVLDSSGSVLGNRIVRDVSKYSKIKNTTFNKIYFGTEMLSSDKASIYYYKQDLFIDDIDYRSSEDIRFIDFGDKDKSGRQLTHSKTISFDVNSNGYAVVVYQDMDGKNRLRISNNSIRFGGNVSIDYYASYENYDFRDVYFVDNSLIALVDAGNDLVWLFKVDFSRKIIQPYLADLPGLTVGKRPIAITFNTDKSRAYVLNESDETLSVINFKNTDGSTKTLPQVVATKKLTDVVFGKEISFKPVDITTRGNDLVLACQATKSLLTLAISEIKESIIDDEDNDEDGYTGAQGDCDDSDASLNPDTLWYVDSDGDGTGSASDTLSQCKQPTGYVLNHNDCDDSDSNTYLDAVELCDGIDNNCDGVVDNNVSTQTWYADSDGDGYGDNGTTQDLCSQPTGYVTDHTDCDDGNVKVSPSETEVCGDGVDNDCNTLIDDGCSSLGSF